MKDMVEILSYLHQYVPQIEFEEQICIPEAQEYITVHKAKTQPILISFLKQGPEVHLK